MIPPWLVELCARLLRNDPELVNLNLNIRRFDTEMLEALASALLRNTILHTLNLTSSLLKASLVPFATRVISRHSSLQVLHLSYNQISDAREIQALAQALTTNSRLTQLYLDHNDIDSEGATILANALTENTTLQVLQLSSNQVRDMGAQAFGRVLANENTSLKRLCLERNMITSKGVEMLLEALRRNVSLDYLELDKRATGVMHQEVEFVLQTNRAGRHLLRQEQQHVPIGLWVFVLQKISKQPDMLFYFLQQVPNLCRRHR